MRSDRHGHWIEVAELRESFISARGLAPTFEIIDVRRQAAVEAGGRLLAGARWREHTDVPGWMNELQRDREVIVYCVHGHNVSQSAAAVLRAAGFRARTLRGGIYGWQHDGGITLNWHRTLHSSREPTHWITPERDARDDALANCVSHFACCWLIRRFIEPRARLLFVGAEQVKPIAEEFAAIAFNCGGEAHATNAGQNGFDALLTQFGIGDGNLLRIARIVRAAQCAQFADSPQASGLLALCEGLARTPGGDDAILAQAFAVYDALYTWSSAHSESSAASQ